MICKMTALLEYLDLQKFSCTKFWYDFCKQNLFSNKNKANYGNDFIHRCRNRGTKGPCPPIICYDLVVNNP